MTFIKDSKISPIKTLIALILVSIITLSLSGEASAQEMRRDYDTESIADESIPQETYRYLNLFGDVFERVREEYVEEVPDKELVEKAINGMLTSLDPHSAFLDESNFEDMRIQTRGEFGGLGIEVTMENGLVKVVAPIDETPAAEAGMMTGDLIVRIDGEEVMGMTLADAVDKMRGKVGTKIVLTVVREGAAEPLTVEIIRDIIKIKSVRYRLEGENDVGYIRITTFNQHVREGLSDAIKEIKKESKGKLRGYVLDLRNNPGGLLDQAIYASDAFLDRGEIVSTRGRKEDDINRVNANPGDVADGLPIVVLINGGSASASEIVAGALQDHHRGIVLGTQSFGKGSVQTIITLPGYGAIRLTTSRYYTPSGRSIQAEGIVPDIEVKLAKIEEIKPSLARTREADLRGALDNGEIEEQKIKVVPVTPEDGDKSEAKKAYDSDEDYQLARAIDLIRGITQFNKYMRVDSDQADNSSVESR